MSKQIHWLTAIICCAALFVTVWSERVGAAQAPTGEIRVEVIDRIREDEGI